MSGSQFKYSWWDFLLTCVGLPLFLLDIVLDVLAAMSFYREKAYVYLGVLLLLLVGSSVLAQAYSWLWYSYDDFQRRTKVENLLSQNQLRLLHVFQLGVYFRHAGVLEMSLKYFLNVEFVCVETFKHLNHDLSMLRIIETFSESTPQLTLMLTIILQRGQLDPVTVLKAVGSALVIALGVTTYHRSLRSFLPDKEKQKITSSAVYFIWNLLLISPRLAALALFASVLPCFIFTHFFCSWLLLFFFAWRSKTDFMESPAGEWLYRATLGLIWYFDWVNPSEGSTRNGTMLYHGFMLADISILCGVWCWKMSTHPPDFVIQPSYALITAVCVVGVYILGLILKVIYYKCFHPNLGRDELKGASREEGQQEEEKESEEETFYECSLQPATPELPPAHCNKRMGKMAVSFFS